MAWHVSTDLLEIKKTRVKGKCIEIAAERVEPYIHKIRHNDDLVSIRHYVYVEGNGDNLVRIEGKTNDDE